MPSLIAVVARGHNIGTVPPAVLLSYQMLPSGLQTTSLAQTQSVRGGETGAIGKPHGGIAVEAPARLAVEGDIAGRLVVVCHSGSRE